ncbi:hypothetical protein BDW02DRAFT_595018 [Decorospora gaudefroyi]|uniref:Myb-like domain-containing protein n=1 Tax=Decorospora gaudefroyi TaxID=184978 RepID=A0A6A5KTB8_9PLEO|nr:hypothetical protein BDW02DRAFT_595018 [Decorospora gaudefroyi]
MVEPYGTPRKVSKAYIFGFSDRPFKEPKPTPPPPRPKKPSALTQMVSTPGGILEWAASDGRKGTLTGTGKPRLTEASLAKVPSVKPSKRSTKALSNNAEGPEVPSDSKKSGSKKSGSKKGETRDTPVTGWGNDAKSGSKKSDSKKGTSDKGNGWNMGGDGDTGGGFNDNAVWDWSTGATGGDDKKQEKKDGNATGWENTTGDAGATTNWNSGNWNDGPAVADKEKKAEESDGWTAEQDKKLLNLKTEDPKTTWAKIAEEVGKSLEECKGRFKTIKPAGWMPNVAKKGGGGDGGSGSKGKNKDKGGKQNQNHGGNNNKEEKNKEEEKKQDADDEKKDHTDKANADKPGDATADGWNAINTANDGANDNTNSGWTNDAANDNTGTAWGTTWDTGAAANNFGTWDNNPTNNNATADLWKTPAPVSKPSSNKAPSHRPSQHNNTSAPRPVELELKPDDKFSADDLRLVARILQQDCSMVWDRVSWRFRDKTGRTLHPDVFEKKITGGVESKRSDRGRRKK